MAKTSNVGQSPAVPVVTGEHATHIRGTQGSSTHDARTTFVPAQHSAPAQLQHFEPQSARASSHPHHPSQVGLGAHQIPDTTDAARAMLRGVGLSASPRLNDPTDIAIANRILANTYKEAHTETVEAEIRYAADSAYEIRLIKDDGDPYGVASGWHLGKTGFQIDYLTPIEFPRGGADRSRDVAAGLALARMMASRHHAQALWVEVDDTMRGVYEKAGFQAFAQPHPDDPAGLTMMVLPLSPSMQKRVAEDATGLWMEHIDAWYSANWDGVTGSDRAPANDALSKMREAAQHGQRQWVQNLPAAPAIDSAP